MTYNSVVQGWYRTSFFHINLRFKWDMEFDTLNDSDRGLILHEYVHFLQNLTTPWGLWSGMIDYALYASIGAYVQPLAKSGKDISLEHFDFSDSMKRMLEAREKGRGTHGDGASCEYITSISRIKGDQPVYLIEGYDIDATGVKLPRKGGVELGAFAIQESMAYMCQQMADPSAKGTSPAYPYDFVQLIADNFYPRIAENKPLLVACCYLSLFSMSPGKRLIELLDDASLIPDVDMKSFVEEHIANDKVMIRNATGEETVCSPIEFYQLSVEKFLKALNALPGVTTQYIEDVLNRTQLANGIIPLLAPFANDTITNADIRAMMEYLGAPMITSGPWICHYPYLPATVNQGLASPDENAESAGDNQLVPSTEIMMLWSYLQLMQILLDPASGCPLRPDCDHHAGDPLCSTPTPWLHPTPCALTPAARAFSLLP